MVFYGHLQQMDGKWSDKWIITGRIWMKQMSISDEDRDKICDPTLAKIPSSFLADNKYEYLCDHFIQR